MASARTTQIAVLVAIVGFGLATTADARPKRPTPGPKVTRKVARKVTHKVTRKVARKVTRSNMPDGWSWPPSRAMVDHGKACAAELDRLGVAWKRATAQQKVATPITVPGMELGGVKLVSTFRKGPHVMDCQLALGLATFGAQLHGLGVREVHFSRIYGYTQVRTQGTTKRALSRHALGLAIDIRAIVDDTGHKAVVVDDYLQDDPLLLRVEAHLNDSGGFRMVLTPRNDPASHYDHFHVEVRVDYDRAPPTRPGA